MNVFSPQAGALGMAAMLSLIGNTAMAQDTAIEGKRLFTQAAVPACAVCHTLKHAGATGEIGPILDELKPDAARVEKAIRNGIGQMPAYTSLTDAQITLLAKYVSETAGK